MKNGTNRYTINRSRSAAGTGTRGALCILLLLASACGQKMKKADQPAVQKPPAMIAADTVKVSRQADHSDFKEFLKTFNADCSFQKRHIDFPLMDLFDDYDTNLIDTNFIAESDYECQQLTAPKSDLFNGRTHLKYTFGPDETIVTIGVEDTGVHVEYIFRKTQGTWRLIRILDASTYRCFH